MDSTTDFAIRTILLATDFSRHAEQARLAAWALAEHFDARLHVLNVVRDPSERAAAMLALDKLQGPPGDVVRAVEVGSASRAIVRYARQEHVDVIVMGTHGRTGIRHLAFGSVTESVLRGAPCQVLAVKLPVEAPPVERAPAPAPAPMSARPDATAVMMAGRCLLCVQPSDEWVCPSCKARVEGEARERKRREMGAKT